MLTQKKPAFRDGDTGSISKSSYQPHHNTSPRSRKSAIAKHCPKHCRDCMGLREIFRNDVSSSAFKLIDGELTIVGKWCRLTLDDDGAFDVWICNPDDLYSGLGVRKVRSVISRLNSPAGSPFHELTGEGWGKVRGKELILQNLALLGIKKKRRVSDEQRLALISRLGESA